MVKINKLRYCVIALLVSLFTTTIALANDKPRCSNEQNNLLTFTLGSSTATGCPTIQTIIFNERKKYVSCSGIQTWDYSGFFTTAYRVTSGKVRKLSHLYTGNKQYLISPENTVTIPLAKNNTVKIATVDYGWDQLYIKITCWTHDLKRLTPAK